MLDRTTGSGTPTSRPRLAIALLLGVCVALLFVHAPATAEGTVTIDVLADDGPVSGAFVALIGEEGRFGGVTDGDGRLVLADVPAGTFAFRASASGTTVGQLEATAVAPGDIITVTVERSGTKFRGLGAYGAQVSSIVPDATPGVFYASTESLPSVFRTADYGGSWAPVTMANDDPDHGIDAMASVRVLATSGFPGEIAAITNNREGDPGELMRLWYSRDFGVTWNCVTATVPNPADVPWQRNVLLWGHVGETSVLFTDGPDDQMWYTVMPTDESPDVEPTLARMENSFKQHPDDRLTIANGSAAPIVAVADAAGNDVRLYTITQAPDRETAPSLTLAAFAPADAPRFLRLGGPTTGPVVGDGSGNNMPNTLLVYSAEGDGSAVMSMYDGTWALTSTAEFRRQESDDVDDAGTFTGVCGATDESGAIGSVSPLGSTGTVGMCWVTQEGDTLLVRPVDGINNNTGVAFDAGYDGGGNRVLISGDGGFGAIKSASMAAELNRPHFPSWPTIATAGHGEGSGGVAINGLDAALVNDVTYGPSADEMVAATGNGRVLGSTDGGASWLTVLWKPHDVAEADPKSGYSVSWWQGADTDTSWIMVGGGDGDLLAVLTTTAGLPDTPVLAALPETAADDLVAPGRTGMGVSVSALEGIPGENAAFVGMTLQAGQTYSGTLRRVELDGIAAPTIDSQGLDGITGAVAALAYCPVDGSDPSIAGKLFVALRASSSGESDGGIAVVENATGSPITVTVPITGDLKEVRAHCASGVVWAGREHTDGSAGWVNENGLLRSTDGGTTFEPVTLDIDEPLAWRMRHVTAIAIDPANALEVVAVGAGGDIVSSSDGGTTWTVQNDTRLMSAKHFGTTVNDIEIPPAPLEARVTAGLRSTPSPQDALLASGSGLFSAAVRAEADATGYRLSIPLIRR